MNASGNSSSATNLAARRQVASRTPSKLSPIQGTPTKPERTSQCAKRDRSKETAKQQKVAASPSRNTWTAKRQSQERATGVGKTQSKERVTSPSKIPLKTNRVSTNTLNPARFINISNNQANGRSKKAGDKGSKEARASTNEQAIESSQGSKQTDSGTSKCSQASNKGSNAERSPAADLHLIDLLKQTSAATGTSSVVNTTATTAVQPLHIDANASVLPDAEVSERRGQLEKTTSQQDLSNTKSANAASVDAAAKQAQSFRVTSGNEDHRQAIQPPISKSGKSNGGRTKAGGTESRNDSPVPTENVGSHSKSNSISQSMKSVSKASNTASNSGSATQRSNRIVQNAVNDQNAKNSRPNEQRIEETASVQPASTNVQSSSSKANEVEPASDAARSPSSTDAQRTAVSVASASVKQEDPARTIPRSTNSSETTTKNAPVPVKSTSNQSATASSRASNNVSNVAGAVNNDSRNANSAGKTAKARADNHGSGTSVKSSARVSVDSIESVRSTDTGVSVDTVKGVSSPREKTGMHVVKRPQEIETLSGNVMYLEQNGEPA